MQDAIRLYQKADGAHLDVRTANEQRPREEGAKLREMRRSVARTLSPLTLVFAWVRWLYCSEM